MSTKNLKMQLKLQVQRPAVKIYLIIIHLTSDLWSRSSSTNFKPISEPFDLLCFCNFDKMMKIFCRGYIHLKHQKLYVCSISRFTGDPVLLYYFDKHNRIKIRWNDTLSLAQ